MQDLGIYRGILSTFPSVTGSNVSKNDSELNFWKTTRFLEKVLRSKNLKTISLLFSPLVRIMIKCSVSKKFESFGQYFFRLGCQKCH